LTVRDFDLGLANGRRDETIDLIGTGRDLLLGKYDPSNPTDEDGLVVFRTVLDRRFEG
jgi:hypothetical protein